MTSGAPIRLKKALGQGFRRVPAQAAQHLWTCPEAEFAAAAQPRDTWWDAGPDAYFGQAYRAIAERFPGQDAATTEQDRTRREVDRICAVAREHFGALTPRILDIPCGYGRHAEELARRGFDVVGMELQEGYLRAAKAGGAALYAAADMRRLPVATGAFDLLVNMWNSLGYFLDERDEVATLEEFRRVLRPGGLALVHGDLDRRAALEGRWVQHMKVPLGDDVLFLVRQVFVAERGGLVCLSWVAFPGEEPLQSPAFFLRVWDDAAWERHARSAGFAAVRIERMRADAPGAPAAGREESVVLLTA
ncbi:methyltransferase domain-containing protein [Roseomonas eburnea]|uniref:Methyltransferase domain-containing protein n=1 Tax=Neoroseomonas eburnea TaxID=1346889 RepID=A0A9X9X780_9PROT|nr:class I SAM-dependent methyltransferase [Neoroseomonas eburnea]MBR0679566.1 methyltransferase domain-containing protein [Neoroseomonas eburnea]